MDDAIITKESPTTGDIAPNAYQEPWGASVVEFLIGPNSPSDFLENYFEQKPIVVLRQDSKRYKDLLSLQRIDDIISGVDLKEGQIDLTHAERSLTRADYLDGGGYADRGRIVEHYRNGASIILQQLHALDPMLARFCQAIEKVFSCHVQSNIYLTPASNQGFRTHYDNHDVFVLQISGAKSWRFYNTPVENPYKGEGYNSQIHKTGEITNEFVLNAGDCIYVTRGLMHDAISSGDEPSLHITIGIIGRSWAELMIEAVSEVALKDAAFRRSLPAGYARPDYNRETARLYFDKLLDAIKDNVKMDAAFDLFVDTFLRSRIADTRNAIVDAHKQISNESFYILRPEVNLQLNFIRDQNGTAKKLRILTAGGNVNFPAEDEEAIKLVMQGKAFKPTALGENSQNLIATLQSYGIIMRLS